MFSLHLFFQFYLMELSRVNALKIPIELSPTDLAIQSTTGSGSGLKNSTLHTIQWPQIDMLPYKKLLGHPMVPPRFLSSYLP